MIHFRRNQSANYGGVEQQIYEQIQKWLPKDSYTDGPEYIRGALNFTLFIDEKAEVLMSHGIADKNYHFRTERHNPKILINNERSRTHLIVPGDFLKRRIVESKQLKFGEDQVHIGGWPRLDFLQQKIDANRRRGNSQQILWAPTHNFVKGVESKRSMSSYPVFSEYFEKLSKHYSTEISLHPRNRKQKRPTDDALVDSDIVITDFGTIVYEALALGKHVIYPTWLIGDEMLRRMKPDMAEFKMFNERIGHHATSYENLIDIIESCRNEKPDAPSFFQSLIGKKSSGGEIMPEASAFLDDYYSNDTFGQDGKRVAEILQELDAKPNAKARKLISFKDLTKKGLRVNNTLDTRSKIVKIKFEPPVQLNNAQLYCYGNVTIGKYSFLRSGTLRFVDTIGRYTSIGPGVILGEVEHPTDWLSTSPAQYNPKQFAFYSPEARVVAKRIVPRNRGNDGSAKGKITIGNDVWIGAGVIIRRGITIGDGAIIAGDAFVTKDVKPYSVVGGLPAKHIRYRFPVRIITKLKKLKWWEFDINDLKGVKFDDIKSAIAEIESLEKSGKIKRKKPTYREAKLTSTGKTKGVLELK